jgi:hypothetical protein
VDDGDDIVLHFFQRFSDHLREDSLSPGDLDFIGLLAVGRGHLVPTLGEGAVDTAQHAFGCQVAHGGFLAASARGGKDKDPVLGIEKLPGFFSGALEDGFEILAAVRHHGLSLGGQHSRIDIDRARDKHR